MYFPNIFTKAGGDSQSIFKRSINLPNPLLHSRLDTRSIFKRYMYLPNPSTIAGCDTSSIFKQCAECSPRVRETRVQPPGQVIPKTQKMVLDAALLSTRHYKVRIKGKVEQSREKSSAFPRHLGVVAIKREPSGHPRLCLSTLLFICIYPTPPLLQDVAQGQFFSGVYVFTQPLHEDVTRGQF